MTTDTQTASTRAAISSPPVRIAIVVVLSFLLGGLTAYAQGGLLPDAFASFANSGSGWTVLTVLLVHYSIVGVVLGPFVGVAASWLRATGVRAALSTALLAGIALGECVHGLTIIRETTSPVFWTVIGVAGLALVTWMLVRRVRGALPVALATGGPLVVAAASYLAYAYLPYVRF